MFNIIIKNIKSERQVEDSQIERVKVKLPLSL